MQRRLSVRSFADLQLEAHATHDRQRQRNPFSRDWLTPTGGRRATPERELAQALKARSRSFNLRCTSIRLVSQQGEKIDNVTVRVDDMLHGQPAAHQRRGQEGGARSRGRP